MYKKGCKISLPYILELYPLHCDPPWIRGYIKSLLNNVRLLFWLKEFLWLSKFVSGENKNFSYAALHLVLAKRPGLGWEVDFWGLQNKICRRALRMGRGDFLGCLETKQLSYFDAKRNFENIWPASCHVKKVEKTFWPHWHSDCDTTLISRKTYKQSSLWLENWAKEVKHKRLGS